MAKIASKRPPRNVVPAPRSYQAQSLITLTKPAVGAVLIKLSRIHTTEAREFYARVMGSWGTRADRQRVTLKLTAPEVELVSSMQLPPTLVECPRWEATYRHPDTGIEITTRTQEKPGKHRSFRVRGGTRKMTLVSLSDLQSVPSTNGSKAATPKEANRMATRTRKKPAPAVEELDELEGLEELDDLEELEDEIEEAPKPKRTRSRKTKPAAVEEPEDEEDDEELEEEPAPKRSRKTAAKKAPAKSKTSPTPPTRELPTGKLGPSDIATLAGVEARDVRQYLRKNEVAKDEELGRYVFTKKQAETHARAIKKAAAGK